MKTNPKIITIDGAVGVGKTSTCSELREMLGKSRVIIDYEHFPNALLNDFYKDKKANGFKFQNIVIMMRYVQYLQAIEQAQAEDIEYIIIDRSVHGDAIFAELNLQKEDLANYNKLKDEYAKSYKYDAMFYISSEDSEMINRIKHRARLSELSVDDKYWISVKNAHDDAFKNSDKVTVIDSTDKTPTEVAQQIYNAITTL